MKQFFQGQIVDIWNETIFPGQIWVENGHISAIQPLDTTFDTFLLPGFVDAHVHIESSMLVPSEFARMAVVHGTVATVSDPHEIANVLGIDGIEFMLKNATMTALKIHFGAPSCVPATGFETAGAKLGAADVDSLLQRPDIWYLSEMMNYPGVLFRDPEVMAKIASAHKLGKPVDGHAPGLRDQDARNYIAAGISTDHECFTYDEALGKLKLGMKIIIREGSAAKNFTALSALIPEYPEQIMFCSDDKHPDDLLIGHINKLASRSIKAGYSLFDTLRAACINPIVHYKLPVGMLRVGDPADFIEVEDLRDFNVISTYIQGQAVYSHGLCRLNSVPVTPVNKFNCQPICPSALHCNLEGKEVRVIKVLDGQLITETLIYHLQDSSGLPDITQDILKIVVVNRYHHASPAVGFIHGFGMKKGALASCVAHDSHNIVAVGLDDESLSLVINAIIENRGGIAAVDGEGSVMDLPLPIAGIMSGDDGPTVAHRYASLDKWVKQELGCILHAPFMSLSFMALLVIPQLKMSDQGLFDGEKFCFVPLTS